MAAVTDTSSELLPQKAGRKLITLTNEGSENAWLKFSEDAVASEGIKLSPTDKLILNNLGNRLGASLNVIAETGKSTTVIAYDL